MTCKLLDVFCSLGYGHVTPKTKAGQLLTMFYALIGIPLTFLYLSNIGNFMADCFRLFYCRILCDVCCCRRCERQRRLQRVSEQRQQSKQSEHCDHSTNMFQPSSVMASKINFRLSTVSVEKDDNDAVVSSKADQHLTRRNPADNFAFEPDDAPTGGTNEHVPFGIASGIGSSNDIRCCQLNSPILPSMSKSSLRRSLYLTPQHPVLNSRHRRQSVTTSGLVLSPCYLLSVPSLMAESNSTPCSPIVMAPTVSSYFSQQQALEQAANYLTVSALPDPVLHVLDEDHRQRHLADPVSDNMLRETDIVSDDDGSSMEGNDPPRNEDAIAGAFNRETKTTKGEFTLASKGKFEPFVCKCV